MGRLVLSVLFGCGVLLAGCGGGSKSDYSTPAEVDSTGVPSTQLRGAIIYHYKQGQVTTEIRADSIKEFQATDSVLAYQIDVDFHDSTGRISSNLVGDSGLTREDSGMVTVYSNVVWIGFDSLGNISSRLAGYSIITVHNGERVTIYDHVVAIRESDSLKVETDSLRWDPAVSDSFPLQTDAFVEFASPSGTNWDGWGLRANRDLSVIRTGEGSGVVNVGDTAEAQK